MYGNNTKSEGKGGREEGREGWGGIEGKKGRKEGN